MDRALVRCVWVMLLILCSPALAGGYSTQSKNYMVDAIQRTTLHSYPTGGSVSPLPLVFVLHGDGGTAAGIRASLPLEAQANGAAAFSYLSSAGASFEYWTDAGRGHEGRFVQAIIANYGVAGVTIDAARVYLVGFSGGGTMAQALGCRLCAGGIRKMSIHSGSLYPVDNDFTYTGNGGVSCSLPGTMLIWGKLDQTNGVDYATGQAIRNNHLATQNCAATTTNTSDAQRFRSVLTEYQKAPQVTRDRMYLETMQQVYTNVSKVLVESRTGSNLLYLPLDRLLQQAGGGQR